MYQPPPMANVIPKNQSNFSTSASRPDDDSELLQMITKLTLIQEKI